MQVFFNVLFLLVIVLFFVLIISPPRDGIIATDRSKRKFIMPGVADFPICRKCGKKKRGTNVGLEFVSSTLCKVCATGTDPIVEVEEGIIVTRDVLKRLRRQAESEAPFTWRDWLSRFALVIVFPLFWYVGIRVGYRDGNPLDFGFLLFIAWGFWMVPVPGIFGTWLSFKLSMPREASVLALIVELARQRKEKLEEAERFYSSPEWNALRQQVVAEEGTRCKDCRREIEMKSDITVDHILPRSKHPELALTRSNLQVLCRGCNARKGTQLLEEEGDE